ncbi:GNAT family N-acetyltransferase [Fontibacillus sp. BL9]|uniref:GNAT family N-acetyltransferase n=1 Tax=Fontibacillus sp. BL9 TaxID=3389971 RepID=UPI0039791182
MYLETNRLILRDFTPEDWEQVHQYSSDDDVVKHMLWGPNSFDETKQYMKDVHLMQQQQPRTGYELAVILKSSQSLIGGCGIHTDGINGELGYCFHKNYWGQGYASEAAKRMLSFGFNELNLHRIYATCRPENVGSAKVMEKIGMLKEGHLREHRWSKERFHDSFLYSILAQEFSDIG